MPREVSLTSRHLQPPREGKKLTQSPNHVTVMTTARNNYGVVRIEEVIPPLGEGQFDGGGDSWAKLQGSGRDFVFGD